MNDETLELTPTQQALKDAYDVALRHSREATGEYYRVALLYRQQVIDYEPFSVAREQMKSAQFAFDMADAAFRNSL